MDNKYHDIMSHVEVTDDMRNRILQNIEKEVTAAPKGRVDSSLMKSRAKVTTIIGVIAACGIVLAVGGILLSVVSRSGTAKAELKTADIAGETTAGVDQAVTNDARSMERDSLDFDSAEGAHSFIYSYEEETTIVCAGTSSIFTGIRNVRMIGNNGKDVTVTDLDTLDEISELFNTMVYDNTSETDISDGITLEVTDDNGVHQVMINDELIAIDDAVYSYTSDIDIVASIRSLMS